MKFALAVEIEADSLEAAWDIAVYNLPRSFRPEDIIDEVKNFHLSAEGGIPAVHGYFDGNLPEPWPPPPEPDPDAFEFVKYGGF